MVARDFETILKGKYPGKAHARKAVGLLSDTICGARGAIYLAGCPTKLLEDSDEAEPFRYLLSKPVSWPHVLTCSCAVNVDTSST